MNQFDLYRSLLPQDPHGFISVGECDALLFSALVGCVPGVDVNLWAAYDGAQWHRRPLSYPRCYPDHSKSSISRDMLLGLLVYAYCRKNLEISESIVRGALKSCGVMGEGVPSRTVISPTLLATAAQVSAYLGGPKRPWLTWIPLQSGLQSGFRAHLHVLHAWLRYSMNRNTGHILTAYADRYPENGLFQACASRTEAAMRCLNDTRLFPADRLPASQDRAAPWLWERDPHADWEPDTAGKIHTGGDYCFAYSIAKGLI